MIIETVIDSLVPSWWEVQVSLAAAAFVVAAYWFFNYVGGENDLAGDRSGVDNSDVAGDVNDDKQKVISVILSVL